MEDKQTRLNAASPTVEALKVVLVEGVWNEAFIDEVCGFPTKAHDEFVDLLCYAVDYHFGGGEGLASKRAYTRASEMLS